jgi:tRNA1(Val) A37 N6-methylase TrmN6
MLFVNPSNGNVLLKKLRTSPADGGFAIFSIRCAMPFAEETPQPVFAGEEVTLDRLAGDWWIYQLRRGHRYATDDVLTAWTAVRARPGALRLLDLGAGVGSVGLMTLQHMPPAAQLTSVEVLAVSAALLEKTVAHNGLQDRVEIFEGDLRQIDLRGSEGAQEGGFDLITANPPYLPAEASLQPGHPQRASARLELHGDVFDYCRCAARHLTPGGRFCFCHAAADPRSAQAVAASGLQILARQEVRFRADRPPSIALFICGREGAHADPAPLSVRDPDGARTAAFRAVRREMWIEP